MMEQNEVGYLKGVLTRSGTLERLIKRNRRIENPIRNMVYPTFEWAGRRLEAAAIPVNTRASGASCSAAPLDFLFKLIHTIV